MLQERRGVRAATCGERIIALRPRYIGTMIFALLFLSAAADWVPMRWPAPDPASLSLLKGTPVNCILLEHGSVSTRVVSAAAQLGVDSLLVIRPGATTEDVRKASELKATGVVLEGAFSDEEAAKLRTTASQSGLITIDLLPRAQMKFDSSQKVVGTFQGVWPGIRVEEDGAAKAAPSGAPWIDTNSGFLRFVRASTDLPVWIGVRPPAKTIVTPERYLQAISDAAIVGARWIVSLDEDFSRRLFAGEDQIRKAWSGIMELLTYYESHKQWRGMKPAGELAILQDVDSGALLSGSLLDMVAVKHTPVRPVPTRKLDATAMQGAKMAVNVDPSSLTETQKQNLLAWRRAGGTLLSGPPTWKFPPPKADQITLSDEDVKLLDDIWKELNGMTGRRNLGARLFNVSSMLSNLVESADGKQTVLHLVNYSGFPVENVTVHVLGKFKTATLLAPGANARKMEVYEIEEGTGIDIDSVAVAATLTLE